MNHKIKIAPSLLSADFANLERDVNICQDGGADIMHFDVMDGHFVPNITFGPLIIASLKAKMLIPADVHLMITEPDRYIPSFVKAGADMISVHVETCNHLHRTLSFIKSFNVKAGIVLNPVTPLEYAYNAAEYCDFVLLMSVNPGFGGQEFIHSFCRKSNHLRSFLDKEGLEHVEIEVDGGIKADNIHLAVQNGSNIIVSGSGVFSGGHIKDNISKLKSNAYSAMI